jgi:Fe2+/Zn2+ uptake regulation proteins
MGIHMDTPTKETRNTRQKRLILDCIKNSGRHMNVEEIYGLIKKHDEKISIATVYRNLRMLEQQGVVKKLYMAEDSPSFYELCGSDEHTHHHLVCSRCGAIIDFEEDLLESLEKTIEEKKGFVIKDHRVVFYGICGACAKADGQPAREPETK